MLCTQKKLAMRAPRVTGATWCTVELGYSTNREDARVLTGRKSQEALAAALADAIVAYLLEYERRSGTGGAGGSR